MPYYERSTGKGLLHKSLLIIFCLVLAGCALTFASAQEKSKPIESSNAELVYNHNPIPGTQYQTMHPMQVTPSDTEKKYDVIVIGAGVSGLETAKHLQSKKLNVLVLEARDRIGGRVWTNNTSTDSFELGASWIHGLGDVSKIGGANPIYLLTKKMNISTVPTNSTMVALYDSHGHNYTENYNPADYNYINSKLQAFLATEDQSKVKSINDVVTDFDNYAKNKNMVYNKNMLNYYLYWWYLLDNVSDNPSELWSGLMFNGTGESYFYGGNSSESIFLNGGYDQVVNTLADGLDIKHAVVKTIEYGNNGVSVSTESNDTFNGRYVVSTLPLGVLKSHKVVFNPPLEKDPNKAKAIKDLNMGVMDKVYFVYNNITEAKTLPFWKIDNGSDWINRVPDNDTDTGWIAFLNLSKYTGKPVLLGFNSGQYARNLENKTNQDIINSGISVLGSMYNTTIPPPDYSSSMITRWGSDPFAGGSYSSIGPNANLTDIDYLAEPLDNRLFFAGEATHKYYFGTVHGAYISGYRAAEEILKLNNNGDSPYKQLENGFSSSDVICRQGFVLLNQTSTNMPACVDSVNTAKLENNGFVPIDTTKYH